MHDAPDHTVYLDHAATTPMLPAAVEAMTAHLGDVGNPSSLHASGRAARRIVEESRETIAQALNCRPGEVVFTSGGTESDNLALKGLFWSRHDADPARVRILASSIEHHAVLDALHWLARGGARRGGAAPRRLARPARRRRLPRGRRAGPGHRRRGLGDVGEQRGRHPPADRGDRGRRRRPRHPGPHRRRPGGRGGAGRLRGQRLRRTDADRSQARRPLRRGGAAAASRAVADPAAPWRGTGARHPQRHPRHARDRGLRDRGGARREGTGGVRRAGGRAARLAGAPRHRGGAPGASARRPRQPPARQRPPRLPRLRGRLAADAARRPRHRVLDRLGLLGRRPPAVPRAAGDGLRRGGRAPLPALHARTHVVRGRRRRSGRRRSVRPSSAPGGHAAR